MGDFPMKICQKSYKTSEICQKCFMLVIIKSIQFFLLSHLWLHAEFPKLESVSHSTFVIKIPYKSNNLAWQTECACRNYSTYKASITNMHFKHRKIKTEQLFQCKCVFNVAVYLSQILNKHKQQKSIKLSPAH